MNFAATSVVVTVFLSITAEVPSQEGPTERQVMTVRGPVAAGQLGVSLTHEHIATDFIGAEKAPGPRYERRLAVQLVLPRLLALKERGCTTLFECTPNYIGRDVGLLLELSTASGLHIVTNTGYYGAVNNRYLPRHAFEETEEELAKRWLAEWKEGIEGTGVRPGFIKLGVGRGKLPALHEKLLRAAARVHLKSGLTIAVHTGDGEAALDELRILGKAGVAAEALVWVHAQNGSRSTQEEVARRGGWVSLDGFSVSPGTPESYVETLTFLRAQGLLGRILVSHDDGWAVEGEAQTGADLRPFQNGNSNPYASIFERLLPDLRQKGFSTDEIQRLLVHNPAEAFAVRVRAVKAIGVESSK